MKPKLSLYRLSKALSQWESYINISCKLDHMAIIQHQLVIYNYLKLPCMTVHFFDEPIVMILDQLVVNLNHDFSCFAGSFDFWFISRWTIINELIPHMLLDQAPLKLTNRTTMYLLILYSCYFHLTTTNTWFLLNLETN